MQMCFVQMCYIILPDFIFWEIAVCNVPTKNTRCSQNVMPAIFYLLTSFLHGNNCYTSKALKHFGSYGISCNCFARQMAALQLITKGQRLTCG